MKTRYLLSLLAILCVQACSTQYFYDVIQHNQRMECQNVPHSEYEECIKRADKSYGTYEKERKEAVE